MPNKRGGGPEPSHAGADGVRRRPEDRRIVARLTQGIGVGHPFAAPTVTAGAAGGEHQSPLGGVSRQRVDLGKPLAGHLARRGNPARQERHVGDDVGHVLAARRKRLAVQASLETIVDPILNHVDLGIAGSILWKSAVDPDPGSRVGPGPKIEVATGAAETIPDMAGYTVPGIRQDRSAPADRGPDLVGRNLAIGRNPKCR